MIRPLFRLRMTEKKRRVVGQMGLSILFLLGLLGHLLGVYSLRPLDRLDAFQHDLLVEMFPATGVDDRVVIVDIDEKSLKEVGRWPWPRTQTAALTSALLSNYGVASVGYDMVFAEPDNSSGLGVLESLAAGPLASDTAFNRRMPEFRNQLDYDGHLAQALSEGESVLGYYFNFAAVPEIVGVLPPPLIACDRLREVGIQPITATGYNANLARLHTAASKAAFFNSWPDFDGVNRRVPMVLEYAGQCYGSLSLLTTQAAMGASNPTVVPSDGLHPPALDLDGMRIPLAQDGTTIVPYRRDAFPYVSATDVLNGRVPASVLEGRVVLIGSSAPGIMDLRVTPLSEVFPGVEIHANVISGLLDGTLLWQPQGLKTIMVWVSFIGGLLLAVILPMTTPMRASLLSILLIAIWMLAASMAWFHGHVSLPIAVPVINVLGLFVLNMTYGFLVEAKSKAQITRLFGQYIPRELVDEMAKDPGSYSLRGESRELTVLFSDIRDFTSISEGLEASQLADMLNAYLSCMTDLIQKQNGTIDKYIGDAIMAFWGAPMSDARHATDGVLTAMAMQTILHELNPRLQAQGFPPVKIGVGVNSGRMSVGNMGSDFRMSYTVMGDAVNLASRLEGLTKQYGVGVLIGELTREMSPELRYVLVDRVRVKGKEKPVAIYEPLGLVDEIAPERLAEAEQFEAALHAYQSRDWAAAQTRLQGLQDQNPRKLYALYLERVAHFMENPPAPDWDGVFTFTTK